MSGAHTDEVGIPAPVPSGQPAASRRRFGPLFFSVAALAVVALGIGATFLTIGISQLFAEPQRVNAAATRVSVDPVSDDLPAANAAPPVSISIPVIGFEATVAPMSVADDSVLYPPTVSEAFWLTDYGMPGVGSTNTTYLIGHTSADGSAVFDPLVDVDAQAPVLLPGDEIVVENENGTVLYEVVSTDRQAKTAVPELETVWRAEPGRLVIITCFFNASRTATPDNMIVYARERG